MIAYQEEIYKAKSIRSRQCREIPGEICSFILLRSQNSIYEWNLGQYSFALRLLDRHASLAYYGLGSSSHIDPPIINNELLLSDELTRLGLTEEVLNHFRDSVIPIWRHARNAKHEYNREFIHANDGRLYVVIFPLRLIHYLNHVEWHNNNRSNVAIVVIAALLKVVGSFFAAIIGFFCDLLTFRYVKIEELKNEHREAMAKKFPELLTKAREEKINDMLDAALSDAEARGVMDGLKAHGIEARLVSGSSEHWVPVSAAGKSDSLNLSVIGEPKAWCAYNFTGIALVADPKVVEELKASKRPLLLHRGATMRALSNKADRPQSAVRARKNSITKEPPAAGAGADAATAGASHV